MITPWERIGLLWALAKKRTSDYAHAANQWSAETKWLWNVNFVFPFLYSYGLIWSANRLNANVFHIAGSDPLYGIYVAMPYIGFYSIILANTFAALRFKKNRYWFCAFIPLNGFAFFFLGTISFATGWFHLAMWKHIPHSYAAYLDRLMH